MSDFIASSSYRSPMALRESAENSIAGRTESVWEFQSGRGAELTGNHEDSTEIVPGVEIKSDSSYKAGVFGGVSTKGEAEASWTSEGASLSAHSDSFVGVEAYGKAEYNGTLAMEGVDSQASVDADLSARVSAGAELKGQADAIMSRDTVQANYNGGAFVGVKAEATGDGALSVDGDDFASVSGGAYASSGYGANISGNVGYDEGSISLGIGSGASLGVGLGYHAEVSVDAPGIITHPDAVFQGIGEDAKAIVTEHAPRAIADGVETVQEWISSPEDWSLF